MAAKLRKKSIILYLCSGLAHLGSTFASENKMTRDMKNTEFNLENLGNIISSDSFASLKGIIEDLGLEFEEVTAL